MSSIKFRKNGGFYSVYGDDAYILNYLFNYKIIDDRVGFPISAYNKIVNILNEKCISNDEKNFKNRNKYNKYLDLGKKKHSLDYRINNILDKLNKLDEKDLNNILDYIESKL